LIAENWVSTVKSKRTATTFLNAEGEQRQDEFSKEVEKSLQSKPR
jgi:hypothetical protein